MPFLFVLLCKCNSDLQPQFLPTPFSPPHTSVLLMRCRKIEVRNQKEDERREKKKEVRRKKKKEVRNQKEKKKTGKRSYTKFTWNERASIFFFESDSSLFSNVYLGLMTNCLFEISISISLHENTTPCLSTRVEHQKSTTKRITLCAVLR